MPARWYYRHDGAEYGPVALPQLAQLASSGQIQLNDLVREGESNAWQPLARSPEVLAAVSTAVAPKPAPPKRVAPKPMAAKSPTSAPVRAAAPKPPAPPQRATAKPAPLPPPPPRPVVSAVPVAVAPAKESSHIGQRRHKKSSPATAIVAVLAVVGGLAVLGIVAVMASMGGDAGPSASVPVAAVAAATKASAEPALSTVQANMTKAISNWRDAKVKGGLKDLISFELKNVSWGASDAAPHRLRVELALTNTAAEPISYASWNSSGKTGAWLVDDKLKLVAMPAGNAGPTQLAPAQTVVEVLEFTTETADFAELRLVLPYAAVERTGQWGYRLDHATLAGEKPLKPAAPLAKNLEPPPSAASAEAEPAAPSAIIDTAPAAAPEITTIKTPEVDDGEPKEDVRDLIKRSTGADKPSVPKNE